MCLSLPKDLNTVLDDKIAKDAKKESAKQQPRANIKHGGWMVKGAELMCHVINSEQDLALETSLKYCSANWDVFNLVRKSLSLIH